MINVVDIRKYDFYHKDKLDFKNYPMDIENRFKTRRESVIDLSSFSCESFKDLIKDYIETEMMKKDINYYTQLKEFLIPINYFLEFLRCYKYTDISNTSSIQFMQMKETYKEWLEEHKIPTVKKCNVKQPFAHSNLTIWDKLYKYNLSSSSSEIYWDRDIWCINELKLDAKRLNETKNIKTLTFHLIQNESSKTYIKNYIKHLIGVTDYSIGTIKHKLNRIKELAIFFNDKDISKLSSEDICNYYDFLEKQKLDNFVYNTKVNTCSTFYEYLLAKKYINVNLMSLKPIKNSPRRYKLTSVAEHIILQIFNVLDKIDEKLRLMFLISYCTGYRVSDICKLKINCLYYSDLIDKSGNQKRRYFIQVDSQKMSKDTETPIPLILYELIKDRINYVKKFNYDEQYLFPSCNVPNKPYLAETYRNQLQNSFKELSIKNQDGSQYIYKPHDYRHTLATDMVELSIPFDVIRRILHHKSPEMTLYYAELRDNKAIDKQKEFITAMGERVKFEDDIELREMAEMEILRKNINAQVLPNGFCGMPTKLGTCDAGNECLNCLKFRTDESFLEIHKKHLKKTEEFLQYAKNKGWQIQIATNERVRDSLIRIINAIENKGVS